METSRFTTSPGDVTTEDVIKLFSDNAYLATELIRDKHGFVDKNLNLLYPCVNIGQLDHELPVVKGTLVSPRILTDEEFNSFYVFGKYPTGRAWVLEAFIATGEVSNLEHIYEHLYKRAAKPGFKRNPDFENESYPY